MNALVIVQILRAPIGGIRKHVIDILESLENENVEQIFITNFKHADKDLAYLNSIANLRIYSFDILDRPGFSDLMNVIAILRLLNRTKIDVIHGHGAKGGLYARIIGLILGVKIFYTPHGGSLHRVFGKIKSLVYDMIERLLAPLTTKFIFESEYSSREFQRHISDVPGKIIVNYNGIDLPDIFKEHIYQSHSLMKFASFGLLRELKGHDIFIRALAQVKCQGIPFEYVIYGAGDFYHTLIHLINKLELSESIFIRPFVNDVYSEMTNYDFVVHPSRFESFGYVPIEAMAVGMPVISSLSGGLNEVVNTDVALISATNSVQEYVEIVENCFNGRYDLSTLRNNGRKWIAVKFSKRRMIDNLLSTYHCP